jgi:hypothetical protein
MLWTPSPAVCAQEEFEAVMLPRHGQPRGLASRRSGAGELPYERLAPGWRLPSAVDWRGTGADGVVKDQATCGSCWAFGATAALQGAYWAATGDPLSLCTCTPQLDRGPAHRVQRWMSMSASSWLQ